MGIELKVSADTITDISMSAAPTPEAGGPRPTAGDMIRQLRSELQKRVTDLEQLAERSHPGSTTRHERNKQKSAFNISHAEAVEDLQEFDKIVSSVPNGFRLEPVLYTRIKYEQNSEVYSEYVSYVRADFMRFLGNNHAEELKQLGICDKGIEQMKQGLDPRNENGVFYDVNIDHIIERNGGGSMSKTRAVDPDKSAGSLPTFLTNHFSNFVLLPVYIHDIKNKLNDLQQASRTEPGQSRWVLMLVPEVSPGHSGYVAQPQGNALETNADFNLGVHHVNDISYVSSMTSRVHDTLEIMSAHPEQKEALQPLLDSALDELTVKLRSAFDNAAKPHHSIKDFSKFYQGEKMETFRQDLESLPPQSTAEVRDVMRVIDSGIRSFFNRRGGYKPPVNGNAQKSRGFGRQPPHQPHRHKQRGKRRHQR